MVGLWGIYGVLLHRGGGGEKNTGPASSLDSKAILVSVSEQILGFLLRDGNTVFPTHLVACMILFEVTYQIASLFERSICFDKDRLIEILEQENDSTIWCLSRCLLCIAISKWCRTLFIEAQVK